MWIIILQEDRKTESLLDIVICLPDEVRANLAVDNELLEGQAGAVITLHEEVGCPVDAEHDHDGHRDPHPRAHVDDIELTVEALVWVAAPATHRVVTFFQ